MKDIIATPRTRCVNILKLKSSEDTADNYITRLGKY